MNIALSITRTSLFFLFLSSFSAMTNLVSAEELLTTEPFETDNPVIQFQQAVNAAEGNIVYVDFWASWCGPCRESFPLMNSWQEKYANESFTIITINVDEKKESALQFLSENPANFTIIYDPEGQLAQAFDVRAMPSSFILNAERELVSKHRGFDSFTGLRIEKEIEKLFIK